MKRVLVFTFALLLVAGAAWAIPPGGGSGVPYSGATGPVDLGSQNVTTTGSISGGNVVVGTAAQWTALTAAPASPAERAWYLADNSSWDPANITGTTPYWVTYCATCGTGSTPKYTAMFDIYGNLLVSSYGLTEKIATFTWDGGGSAITAGAGTKRCIRVPFAATITKATIKADASTTSTVAIYKDAWATGALATTDINGATADLTVTAALGLQDSTLTGWTTTVTAGDEICAACTANDNAKWLYVVLEGTR